MKKNKKQRDEGMISPYKITAASLKDDICNYTYEITSGVGEGDVHNVKGKGIAKDELLDAFRNFNVHLACIDDVFKHRGITVENLDAYRNHELAALYQVTGFKIKGHGDDESIVLVGMKSITATGGRIEIETPKIPMDRLSSYTWYNELLEAADYARKQVDAYKCGNYIPVETAEATDEKQLTIADGMDEHELENARV